MTYLLTAYDLPTLRIQFKTRFGIITDPRLYTSLHECHTVIGIRQRDFSTSLTVTITDMHTKMRVAELFFTKGELPFDGLSLL